MTIQKVKEEALTMSRKDRAQLAHLLLSSLDTGSRNTFEAEWNDEIQRRSSEVEAGTAQGRPAFAALDEIEAQHR